MTDGEFSKELKALCAKSGDVRFDKKEYLPFWMHSMDVAGIIDKLAYRWIPDSVYNAAGALSPENLRKTLHFLALVHDIGKMTQAFQSKILYSVDNLQNKLMDVGISLPRLKNPSKSPHTIAGEAILLKLGCPKELSSIIGAHHGKPRTIGENPRDNMEYYEKNYYKGPSQETWKRVWKEWLDYALKDSGFESVENLPKIDMATQMLFTGILIVADWIASNTKYFPLITGEAENSIPVYPARITSAWSLLQFPEQWKPAYPGMTEEDFCDEFGFAQNAVQKKFISVAKEIKSPGLMILEAPMGVGKTEAALSAAEILAARLGAGGLFFGLPSQATANGLFSRVLGWVANQSLYDAHTINLIHGNAGLNQEFQSIALYRALDGEMGRVGEDIQEGGIYRNEWLERGKTGMLSDFVVGTVDQLLMAALKRKHVMLRLLGLVGKVVVVDECHAYDAYMNYYFDRVLSWLGKYDIPVILLSATLPAKRRREVTEAYLKLKHGAETAPCVVDTTDCMYPAVTWTEGTDVLRDGIAKGGESTNVQIGELQATSLITELKARLRNGGCAGVIVNTVKKAQEIAIDISKRMPEYEVILYHSRFTMQDRADLECQILRRTGKDSAPEERKRLIIIGTQVLEQSLDIDFDLMISELCPVDLLLQRIGRLHRHKRARPKNLQDALCLILTPEGSDSPYDEGTKRVYDEWLLSRTYEEVRNLEQGTVAIPENIPTLVEAVYREPRSEALSVRQKELWGNYRSKIERKKSKAFAYCLPDPNWDSTIAGLLDTYIEGDNAEDAVRDSGASIEAIVVKKCADGSVGFVSKGNRGKQVSLYETPSFDDACFLLTQKIRFPKAFCVSWSKTVEELASRGGIFRNWRESKLLSKEYFLLLDENLQGQLCGYDIEYSDEYGFSYAKKQKGGNTVYEQ